MATFAKRQPLRIPDLAACGSRGPMIGGKNT
jgi:hypothetical protein